MPLSPVNSNTQMSVYMHNCIFIWNFFIFFSILYFCVYLILLVSWQQIVLLDEQLKDVQESPTNLISRSSHVMLVGQIYLKRAEILFLAWILKIAWANRDATLNSVSFSFASRCGDVGIVFRMTTSDNDEFAIRSLPCPLNSP